TLKILIARGAGGVSAIVPLYVERCWGLRVLRLLGTQSGRNPYNIAPFFEHGGDPATARLLAQALLAMRCYDVLQLADIDASSPLAMTLPHAAQTAGLRYEVERTARLMHLPLPASWNEYLRSLRSERRARVRHRRQALLDAQAARFFVWQAGPGRHRQCACHAAPDARHSCGAAIDPARYARGGRAGRPAAPLLPADWGAHRRARLRHSTARTGGGHADRVRPALRALASRQRAAAVRHRACHRGRRDGFRFPMWRGRLRRSGSQRADRRYRLPVGDGGGDVPCSGNFRPQADRWRSAVAAARCLPHERHEITALDGSALAIPRFRERRGIAAGGAQGNRHGCTPTRLGALSRGGAHLSATPVAAGRPAMRVERRNLFVTLRMLHTAGIEADARLLGERIQVLLRNPDPGAAPLEATFEVTQIVHAANWLVACVVDYYPKSDLAKVWGMIYDASVLR